MKSPPQKREDSDPTLKRAGESTRSILPANLLLVGPAHSRGKAKDEHHNIRTKHAPYIGVAGLRTRMPTGVRPRIDLQPTARLQAPDEHPPAWNVAAM